MAAYQATLLEHKMAGVYRPRVKKERNYLRKEEVLALISSSKEGRHGIRDLAMCLLLVNHGFRVSELCALSIDAVNFHDRHVVVTRLKGSKSSVQPLYDMEARAITRWLKHRPDINTPHLFLSAQGFPFRRQSLNYLVKSWADRAGIPFRIGPHSLRHTCGYRMMNRKGGTDLRMMQDYLGHRDPRHTATYTALSDERFSELLPWGF